MKKEYAKLFENAKKAKERAYCPYSKFKVGAAVLTGTGKIFTGSNVENASYGLSCCAERVAVFKAVAAGERVIKAVAVAGSGKLSAAPCGACRQVIHEFGGGADVITGGASAKKVMKISRLLPDAFGGINLKKK